MPAFGCDHAPILLLCGRCKTCSSQIPHKENNLVLAGLWGWLLFPEVALRSTSGYALVVPAGLETIHFLNGTLMRNLGSISMKHIVMGTAGHVDHGKTSLIKALTGIDTDRLKEEKERGITIEPGFASLDLPDGLRLGVVDVPGHERFIKNMMAGASGIDFVMLVIAADEGVMPQTKEHLCICSFLGISKGIVVITKTDLIDPEWLELVMDDVTNFLEDSFLEGAPVVPVSAATGAGLPELMREMDKLAQTIDAGDDHGIFRLPVDRVFTMKGFGTVVTGTILSGTIASGETVEILPSGIRGKIRGIQVHNVLVEQAEGGQRTAVNLQGLAREAVIRGNVLVHPGTFIPSRLLDVTFEYLPGFERILKHRALIRVHCGTSEIMARLLLVDREEMKSGERIFAQLLLDEPIAAIAGDPFVVRNYSPVTTIGGGVIHDPHPPRHKRFNDDIISDFAVLAGDNSAGKVRVILKRGGLGGVTFHELTLHTGITGKTLRKILEQMFSAGEALLPDKQEMRVLSRHAWETLLGRVETILKRYHLHNPLRAGISREELKVNLSLTYDQKVFAAVMRDLEKRGKIVIEQENVRLAGHYVDLGEDLAVLRQKIEDIYISSGLTPPSTKEVMERYPDQKKKAEDVFAVLLREGALIRVGEGLNFHRSAIAKLREDYKNLLLLQNEATPASFKDLTGLSRKYIIPLMEYFDMDKLTIRSGDVRILRERV